MNYIEEIGKRAKAASYILAKTNDDERNSALLNAAEALCKNTELILAENAKDVKAAKEKGTTDAMIDRLKLDEKRIFAMAEGLRQIAELKNPVGEIVSENLRPNGLRIVQQRVPMGVIGIIYESRPNVTADAFGLCFKTANAVILRGGSDAIKSNTAICNVLRNALEKSGITPDAVILVEDTSREVAGNMMQMKKYLDVLIPRGGAGLIKRVTEESSVPVIETGTGNCHIYIDETADLDMAVRIVENAKTQRMGVCNACESLLVNANVAKKTLPKIFEMLKKHNITVYGCERTRAIVECDEATDDDYGTEYLGPEISCKVVDSTDEAIEHINKYNTGHSEAIITKSEKDAEKFLQGVDAAAVYVNASTRFTDGFEFGYGAEIGISTQKLHARGPMGLVALTTVKDLIYGTGQVRE